MLVPGQQVELAVEKPAAGGRMIARHEGQVVFVLGAIPGERVVARIDRVERQLAFATTVDVPAPSPDRREPVVDLSCGGCLYAHVTYPRQVALKAEVIADAFTRLGRMALPPENSAFTGTVGTTLKLGKKSRLVADLSIGSWKQDTTPFIPYTTNTAIRGENFNGSTFDPTITSTLPAQRLDGKADVTSFNATFSSRPSKVYFTARYRYYDLDNETAVIEFDVFSRPR